jgi:thioredoxin 1
MGIAFVVDDQTFTSEIEETAGVAVVDFWAPWCGPCRALAPALEQIARHYAGRIKVAKLNIDENPLTTSQFGVRSIPTLMFFRNGVLVDTVVGIIPRPAFTARIDALLESTA